MATYESVLDTMNDEIIHLEDIDLFAIGAEIQISGVLWTGLGTTFITQIPGKDDDLSNLKKMPLTLEEWQKLNRQADLQEVEILQHDSTGLVKIILRKTQRQLDSYLQWACFKRDNYRCRYCGKDGIPLTVDHIDLWEDGGPALLINLLTACRACNKDRGRMKYEDWIISKTYQQKSSQLTSQELAKNVEVLDILAEIRKQRVQHVRSR